MIFEIKKFNSYSDYIVDDQAIIDAAIDNPFIGSIKIGTEQDALDLLAINQQSALEIEKIRFSITLTIVNGTDTTWREMIDSDPEDNLYKVFNFATGQYKDCSTKTEALQENDLRKQEFLNSVGLDNIIIVESLPKFKKHKEPPTV
jgi:hypothetical protein